MNLDELSKMYDFACKTIVVTGGAGILGGEMACALVGCHANVAIVDREPALADRWMDQLKAGPGRALVVYGDVLNTDTLRQAADVIEREFGAIHGLINAAGGNSPNATTNPGLSFFDLSGDALRWVFDLHSWDYTTLTGLWSAHGGTPRGSDPEYLFNELLSPADPHSGVFGRQGRCQQLHPMAGRPHGTRILAQHSSECSSPGIFLDPAEQVSDDG